jgi:Xaa-Pro aminopeptidase
MDKYKRFPKEEYKGRWSKARKLMESNGLDGLLIMEGTNFIYFSGGLRDATLSRSTFMLLPMEGEPVVLVQWCNKENQTRTCQVDDIRYYRELGYAPIKMIKKVFEEKRMEKGKIGAELGFEQRLAISYNDFMLLKGELPKVDFVDASKLFWNLRMVKSEAEIGRIRKACAITSEAYQELLDNIHEGMTEKQVANIFLRLHTEKGGSSPWVIINSDPGNYNVYGRTVNAPDRKLKKGNTLWMDGGCSYQDYWSDFTVMAMIGTPSSKQKKMYEQVAKIERDIIDTILPGVKVSELDSMNSEKYKEIGIDYMAIDVGGGRIGHGVGLVGTEPPHIAVYDDTVLKPNMVITIEPGVVTNYGYFQIEENILVTEDGYELLSKISRKMRFI